MGVARDALLRGHHATLNIIARDAVLLFIGVLVVNLDVFLDVAGSRVLRVTALEGVPARLEERLGRAERRLDVVAGGLGHLLAQLGGPEGPVARDFIGGGHARLVVRIVRPDRARLGSACREN